MVAQLENTRPSIDNAERARKLLRIKALVRLLVGTLPFALTFGLLVWFLRTVILERGESTYWWEPGPRVGDKHIQSATSASVQGFLDIDHHAFWLVTLLTICLSVLTLASLFVLLKTLEQDDS
jgi:hypothetical protein